jgi:bifunctional enzyme CysN/CysC/sulfate adenylyltransferase subunit 1
MALPSRKESTVSRIVTYDGDLDAAAYPQSVTVELEDEIDLSRGEMLVSALEDADLPEVSRRFRAMVVWMHEEPLVVGRTYVAKHTTRTVRATVRAIRYRVDVNSLEHDAANRLEMNEIAEVEFETNLPLFFDAYRDNRWTGSLIVIEGLTKATVGPAMIVAAVESSVEDVRRAVLVLVRGQVELAERVREGLLAHGERAVVVDDDLIPEGSLVGVVRALQLAGVVAISTREIGGENLLRIQEFAEGGVVTDDEEVLRLAGVTE